MFDISADLHKSAKFDTLTHFARRATIVHNPPVARRATLVATIKIENELIFLFSFNNFLLLNILVY